MAAPFVEGRLLEQSLRADIRSRCVHCDREIVFSLDSDLHYEGPAGLLVFEPRVDWATFDQPNIIGHY